MKRNTTKVGLVLLLAIASMGAACEDKQRATMQGFNDFSIALDGVVDAVIDIHEAGKITKEQQDSILLKLRDVAVTTRTAERTFLAGGDASGTLQTIQVSLNALAANEFPAIVDTVARDTVLVALGTAKNLLTVLIG